MNLPDPVREINAQNEQRLDGVLMQLFKHGVCEGAWPSSKDRRFLDAFYCLMDALFTERFVYAQSEHGRRRASAWFVFWQGMTRFRPEADARVLTENELRILKKRAREGRSQPFAIIVQCVSTT